MLSKRIAKVSAYAALGFALLVAIALAKSATTIVPFKSVGPLKLGMTLAQVKAAWGAPSKTDTFKNDPSSPSYDPTAPRLMEVLTYSAPSKQAHVILAGNNATSLRMDGIDTKASTFKTSAGFGVGSSINKAASQYPNYTCNDANATQTFKLHSHSSSKKPASCYLYKHGSKTETVITPGGATIHLQECDDFLFQFFKQGHPTNSVTYVSTGDPLTLAGQC